MFSTKAQTLLKLHIDCPEINTLPGYIVYGNAFSDEVIKEIISFSGGKELIVRSSCKAEDAVNGSNAGKFESVLHVKPVSEEIEKALKRVYGSYGDLADEEEEIFVQPMLPNIKKSGVVFTRDLYSGAPYYIIDYSEGNDTVAVTSGNGNEDTVYVIFKGYTNYVEDEDVTRLLDTVKLLEKYFESDALDIEFGITEADEVYIFQVRPIAVEQNRIVEIDKLVTSLNGIYKKVEKLMRPHPLIAGNTTCFGVMPDWNPAEILGTHPKKLAISLYKELITDSIWAHQRQDYGYRNLTQCPLMVLFCGIPYIDTRITFNSFVPAALSERLANKLVNYYIERLKKHPSYHDKIEFEIVFSCYYIGIAEDLTCLQEHGFSENECKRIEFALLELTNRIIRPDEGLYKKDIERIETLKINHDRILKSDLSTVDKIYWLIEECKKNGTLPFAGGARAGFIAVQFMKSLVKKEIITRDQYDRLMLSLNTISKQMGQDRKNVESGNMTKEAFIEKYGHVRPGTYDLESPRYDEAYDMYFENVSSGIGSEVVSKEGDNETDIFSSDDLRRIDDVLEENGICVDSAGLLQFMKEAIEGREYLKFVFTRTVSEILRQIETYGRRLGISKADLAHLDIKELICLYSDLYYNDIFNLFMQNIENNKNQYAVTTQIKFPALIVKPKDIYAFKMFEDEPNFITLNSVIAEVVREENIQETNVKGKIVCIKAADPGYDYLFSKGIGGLITQFGGANSHMAIRCAELGIPAVIGVGEKNYNTWSGQKRLLLDAGRHQVKYL